MVKESTLCKEKILEYLFNNQDIANNFLNCKKPKDRLIFLKTTPSLKKILGNENITTYIATTIYNELLDYQNKNINSKLNNKIDKVNENDLQKTTSTFNSMGFDQFEMDLPTIKQPNTSEFEIYNLNSISQSLSNKKIIDSSEDADIISLTKEDAESFAILEDIEQRFKDIVDENKKLKEIIKELTEEKNSNNSNKTNEEHINDDSIKNKQILQMVKLVNMNCEKINIQISKDIIQKASKFIDNNNLLNTECLINENITIPSIVVETILLAFINQNSLI